jgi:hypothetical protein
MKRPLSILWALALLALVLVYALAFAAGDPAQ